MNIGFSTGSLTRGDYKMGISLMKKANATTIELSSLRENEFRGLIHDLDTLNLSDFKYISFHAPSKLVEISEEECVSLLLKVAKYEYYIIVHPDIITDYSLWRKLGQYLCIENMDKRKSIGQTTDELEVIFSKLPDATFCLDLAHARQIDPTMLEAITMIKNFKNRLVQLHISDVNYDCKHEPLNIEAILAFQKVAEYLDPKIPCILESPISAIRIKSEIKLASFIFDKEELKKKQNKKEFSFTSLLF